MEIYTLMMTKESFSNPPVTEVVGSYREGWRARSALMAKIIDMAQKDVEFAFALWNDENHEDFRDVLSGHENLFSRGDCFSFPESEVTFPECVKMTMRNYLEQEIGGDEGSYHGAYHVYSSAAYDRDATYRFDIILNDLELED